MIDKTYCASHYLAFRFVRDEGANFFDGLTHKVFKPREASEIRGVKSAGEICEIMREKIAEFFIPQKTAVLLSGGIDSAVVASFLPRGTKAYTFKCIAPNAIDETAQARRYCEIYGLEQEIIEMRWEDFEALTPEILRFDGVPFHSIEVQLVKAAKLAKSQGIERVLVGESADLVFGGMDKLLARDWAFDEFVARYTFTEPAAALKESVSVREFYEAYRLAGDKIDFLRFMDEVFAVESSTSYMHAFEKEGLAYLDPYSFMKMSEPLDLRRVRGGEPKYLVREAFAARYPNLEIPAKIPMPRATNDWLAGYHPHRAEFKADCEREMSGDQKWQLYCLERFFDMHDKGIL